MKKIESLHSLLLILLLISCSDKSNEIGELSLKGQYVKIEDGKCLRYIFNDFSYVQDTKFNIYAGKMLKDGLHESEKVFVSGHGHNEFGYIALSQDNEGSLYVLDRPFSGNKLISLTKIKNPDNINLKDKTKWVKFNFDRLPPLYQLGNKFVVLSDSTILVTGAPAKDMCHVFTVVNFKKQTVTPLDYWPKDDSNNIDAKLQRYTYDSGILWNGKDRYLYWNGWGPLAFVFSIDGAKVNILNHMYSNAFPTKETPATQRVYCCADSNRIYLLFKDSDDKGTRLEKFNPRFPFPMGSTVEVYDWDGVKQQVIHLDKVGREIMLSQDGQKLYLYSYYMDNGDEYVYSYDLSSLN